MSTTVEYPRGTALRRAVERLAAAGALRLYGKALAPNDNSKNQVYLGGSLAAVNLLPAREIVPDPRNAQRLKAPLDFYWLTDAAPAAAPSAQLILYPDYPEVRLSGFLKGSRGAPASVMTSREPGRVLLLGVRGDDSILALALGASDSAAREFIAGQSGFESHGVLCELPLPDDGDDGGFAALMTRLSAVHHKGWIRSWSLDADGKGVPCEAPQCGGYTLEAELGIRRNGRSEPDFRGWEIKSFVVPELTRPSPGAKALTLMTPEPTGSLYHQDFAEFWKRYSYPDRSGKPGREQRRNFGGIYRCGAEPNPTTGLRLVLDGYDDDKGLFAGDGQLALVDRSDRVAASWSFASLLEKWSRKHSRAAYVPHESRIGPRCYRYGATIGVGRGADFVRLLRATARGCVYVDPAVKDEGGKFKKRNQFRVAHRDLSQLYTAFGEVGVSPLD